MSDAPASSVQQKALRINLDAARYGTFAEIGAGQEVVRHFFRAGGASGTVAKTSSAYDMAVSDAIYGPADRYVSRQRLVAMLDREYSLLLERLGNTRGADTALFVFADTVATTGFKSKNDGHGWMGIRFQAWPGAAPSDILIHVRMLDKESERQQEVLGVLGVNLIHGTFYSYRQPEVLIRELLDGLTWEQVEVDMIRFSGPAFQAVDNRLMALQLVKSGHTEAAMFTADGEVVQWAEVLYKKPVLVQRGSYRPMTRPMLDMLRRAEAEFLRQPEVEGETDVVLLEMTLRQLTIGNEINHRDFLDRVDMLSALGHPVLISNFLRFHRLVAYLSRYTQRPIGLPLGAVRLRDIMQERYYTDMPGGILQGLGQMFRRGVTLYVYPSLEPNGQVLTARTLEVAPNLQHLYQHLLENGLVRDLTEYDSACLGCSSSKVLQQIQDGDAAWEQDVPGPLAEVIKRNRLFRRG